MIKTREVVLITGKTGSGKSTLFRQMIQQKPRFVIYDAIGEYAVLSPAFPALYITTPEQLRQVLLAQYTGPLRVVFAPDPGVKVGSAFHGEFPVFDWFCWLFSQALTDITMGIEEIGNFVDRSNMPQVLENVIRFGRHSLISVYATTQRPADMPTLLRSQATRFIAFRQHLPNDIDWIGDCIGDKKEAESLRDLKQFSWPGPMVSGQHYKEYTL